MRADSPYTDVAAIDMGAIPPALRPPAILARGSYLLRFAETPAEKEAAFRLRFEVFNLELNEGLTEAYWKGVDSDEFDAVCDHLIVEHEPSGQVVGTYRLQTGATAASHLGYYGAREFDFAPYELLRPQMVELGRAAIRRDHRSFDVLNLLWRGIAEYAQDRGARFLIGCSSLTSQSSEEGAKVFNALRHSLVEPRLRTKPLQGFEVQTNEATGATQLGKPPKLLLAYLAIGARICSKPAIDREFKTIDFLTLLDLEQLSPAARARFLR